MKISYWVYLLRSVYFYLFTISVSFLYPVVYQKLLLGWGRVYYATIQSGYPELIGVALFACFVTLIHYAHRSIPRKIIGMLTLVFGLIAVLGMQYGLYRSAIDLQGLGSTVFDSNYPALAYAWVGEFKNVSYFGLYLLWKPFVAGVFAAFLAFPFLFVAYAGMRQDFFENVKGSGGVGSLWPLRIATSVLYGRYIQFTTQEKLEELCKRVQEHGLSAANFKGGVGVLAASTAAYTVSEGGFDWNSSFNSPAFGSLGGGFETTSKLAINPASGLPMAGNSMAGLDVGGNAFGTNSNNMFNDSHFSSIHDSWSSGSSFDQAFSSTHDSFSSFS